ncbi:MAG: class I SAM-dependent methyltransferase [Candidatus Methylomirabilales bacterium]
MGGDYLEYQKKYATQIRESDRVIIEMVREIVQRRGDIGRSLSLVDIGCSSGNLLFHLKHKVPEVVLTGGEVYPKIVEQCRKNPALSGINFEEMDLLRLSRKREFDIVVVNAVLCLFDEEGFDLAVGNIADGLRGHGALIVFDWFHPYEQELTIIERSKTHLGGLEIRFRSYRRVTTALEKSGFSGISFQPFKIPIDLPEPEDGSDISSHTVRMESGERLIFRGALFTPWCHVLAEKG